MCREENYAGDVRCEGFTAVTKKNVVFWDTKTCSYLRRNTYLRYRAQPVNAM
jgi:hypothetical protein